MVRRDECRNRFSISYCGNGTTFIYFYLFSAEFSNNSLGEVVVPGTGNITFTISSTMTQPCVGGNVEHAARRKWLRLMVKVEDNSGRSWSRRGMPLKRRDTEKEGHAE